MGTHVNGPRTRGRLVYVPLGVRSCYKCHAIKGSRSVATVYYISKTLVDVETRYLPLEKLVLALIHTTRKLPHYFQAHTVYVLIEYPLQLLSKRSDFTGRIAKWGTRLGSFDIRYRPRSSVKGKSLFILLQNFLPRTNEK